MPNDVELFGRKRRILSAEIWAATDEVKYISRLLQSPNIIITTEITEHGQISKSSRRQVTADSIWLTTVSTAAFNAQQRFSDCLQPKTPHKLV